MDDDYDEWLRTAQEIEQRLAMLDNILAEESAKSTDDDTSQQSVDSQPAQIDSEEEIGPGIYAAIIDYDSNIQNHITLNLGQVIKVLRIENELAFWYLMLISETQKLDTGYVPLNVLLKLADELVLELADSKSNHPVLIPMPLPGFDSPSEAEELVSLADLKAMANEYKTHCMQTIGPPSIYFVWKYGGQRVAVWGSFNNWSRPIPLFYDGQAGMFVAFTEVEDLEMGEICHYVCLY